MAFGVSPGVSIKEFDIAAIVPAVDSSTAAFAGVFRWGPVGQRVLIDSEAALAARFGKPTNFNAESWFSAANFLSYSSSLMVVRAANTTSPNATSGVLSAIANTGNVANLTAQMVKNESHYETKDGTFTANVVYVARYPGSLGNSLKISVVDSANQFTSSINLVSLGASLSIDVGSSTAEVVFAGDSNTAVGTARATFANNLALTDLLEVGNTVTGKQFMKINAITDGALTGNSTVGEAILTLTFEDELKTLGNAVMSTSVNRYWEYFEQLNGAPGVSSFSEENGNGAADEVHVVVVDEDGKFTGIPGTVLEVYQGLSRATDSVSGNGLTNYYKEVINQKSQYVWFARDRVNAASALAEAVVASTETKPLVLSFAGGGDGPDEDNVSVGDLAAGYDLFASDSEVFDVGLIIAGKARGGTLGGQLANYIIDNICEVKKDCVVFISPPKAAVVNNVDQEADDIIAFRNTLRSTSYGFMDSGYKYQYDRYNDVYRYVPLCGDIAGLAARTDATNDAWWSPAGFNRGQVKNITRLAWNPRKAFRNILYKAGINPVASFEGQGVVLYGDKTLLSKPSAFDRINVRRLFIVLEKAIATAAKFQLFEFNDDFTRAQFRNMVNPYLRDIQGRRGITDFLVVCDETNNPGSVVDRNEFVGHLYIKPARSINFITLNFVAVGTDVQFTEVVGNVG